MRLDIELQEAVQGVEIAEGEYNELASSFKALLAIKNEGTLKIRNLITVSIPLTISELEKSLLTHPAIEADKFAILSAEEAIKLKKSERFDDPTISIFQGKDFLDNNRESVTGVMLSIQMPLWGMNNGGVDQARHSAYQAQADFDLTKRNLTTNLQTSYLHLGHLIEQAEHYRKNLLSPSKEVLRLTQKGFAAGEQNILSLIDANNIYYDTQERYYELLQEGWLELSEIRKSAGLFVLTNSTNTNVSEED
jgi:cobalt-zinc-cadmium efflux system outer membrane protein